MPDYQFLFDDDPPGAAGDTVACNDDDEAIHQASRALIQEAMDSVRAAGGPVDRSVTVAQGTRRVTRVHLVLNYQY